MFKQHYSQQFRLPTNPNDYPESEDDGMEMTVGQVPEFIVTIMEDYSFSEDEKNTLYEEIWYVIYQFRVL